MNVNIKLEARCTGSIQYSTECACARVDTDTTSGPKNTRVLVVELVLPFERSIADDAVVHEHLWRGDAFGLEGASQVAQEVDEHSNTGVLHNTSACTIQ